MCYISWKKISWKFLWTRSQHRYAPSFLYSTCCKKCLIFVLYHVLLVFRFHGGLEFIKNQAVFDISHVRHLRAVMRSLVMSFFSDSYPAGSTVQSDHHSDESGLRRYNTLVSKNSDSWQFSLLAILRRSVVAPRQLRAVFSGLEMCKTSSWSLFKICRTVVTLAPTSWAIFQIDLEGSRSLVITLLVIWGLPLTFSDHCFNYSGSAQNLRNFKRGDELFF